MSEFFNGWKRKAGCATLGLACVLAVGWMRSTATSDAILFYRYYDTSEPIHRTKLFWLWSFDGNLSLNWDQNAPDESPNTEWHIFVDPELLWTFNHVGERPAEITADWPWLCGAVAFGEFQSKTGARQSRHWVCATQYWSLVLPLTLLSARLLLSKPEESKSNVEPIGADGESHA